MSIKEIILDRSEFVTMLSERLENPTDIAKALRFVEASFILQNDAGRPAYVMSVSEKIAEEDMELIRKAFVETGVIGVFLPAALMDMVNYEGTLTPESMGIKREG